MKAADDIWLIKMRNKSIKLRYNTILFLTFHITVGYFNFTKDKIEYLLNSLKYSLLNKFSLMVERLVDLKIFKAIISK